MGVWSRSKEFGAARMRWESRNLQGFGRLEIGGGRSGQEFGRAQIIHRHLEESDGRW